MIYAGGQLIEVIPKYYNRPGRILHIISPDLDTEEVMVQPGAMGSNGLPQQINPELAQFAQGLKGFFDPTAGKYAVTVDIGKGFPTKRAEAAAVLGELIGNLPPPIAAAITPPFLRNMDMPNAQEIADLAQKALPPELQ